MRRRIRLDRFAPASLLIVIATLLLTVLSADLASAQDEDADPSGSAQDMDVNRPPTDWEKAFMDFLARWVREHPNATDADLFEAQAQWIRDNPDPDFAERADRQAAEAAALDAAFAEAMIRPPPDIGYWLEPADPLAEALAQAGRWEDARAFYGRYPAGSKQAALALLILSGLLEYSGEEFDDVSALRTAMTILVARKDTEDNLLAHVALAFTNHLRGANFQTEQIVAELETLLGPRHQLIANFLRQQSAWVGLNELGTLRIEQTSEDCRRTAAEALELNRNAFEIEQGLHPADSFELVLATAILAEAFMQAGDLETAEAHYLEASRIAALYVAPVETVEVLTDLGAVRLRRQLWTDALLNFDDGLAMLAEAEASGELTEFRRDVIRYRLNRGRGDAAFQLADYAAAVSGYGRALPGSPIVDCFAGRSDSPGYDWTCGYLWSGDVCDAQSIMDEAAFLDAHAQALMETGRSAHATRLAWFASLAVIEHTRNRYTLDPRGRSEFGRRQNTHRTFVSAAWDGS